MWKVLIFVSFLLFFQSAITHTSRSDKTQATFYWTPGQDLGHINFRFVLICFLKKTHFDSPTMLIFDTWYIYTYFLIPSATVVQNFNTFWVNITSPELRNSVNPVPGPSCQTNGNQDNAGADLKAHTVFSILSILAALFFVL